MALAHTSEIHAPVFPGYTLAEEVYRGRRRVVYRGTRERDGAPVIIKTLVDRTAGTEALAREYELIRSLEIEGVPRAVELLRAGDSVALVLQDSGRPRLATLISAGGMELTRFLRIAIQLSEVVRGLHERKIIHKDINPNNILVDPRTGQVTLIEFSIASRVPTEHQELRHPNVLEGTLAYLSPEQTGRMNRDIDYRTDFYSMGVTFYEMLTGRLPFEPSDPLEVIHGHIARTPPSPREYQPEIPLPLSDIIMKLLAKAAEERYQSATRLKADLSLCLSEWQANRHIRTVVPSRSDTGDRFLVPQRLYGRERQLAELMAAFEQVGAGASQLMLVSGYSGVGKSSLIRELYKPLLGRRGYFIAGKFDQIIRVPYGALLQAFRELIQQLLTEDEEQLALWRARLNGALGNGAAVLAEVVPEVEQIVGRQPPAPILGPAETRNRFRLVIQNFLRALARREHPLVIFLDDLQWADSATLNLLEPLLAGAEIECLLLIGAYRDNDVDAAHPLFRTLAELMTAGVVTRQLPLSPLALPDLTNLVHDTLHCDPGDAERLARLLAQKTEGNPFFVGQFLKALREAELLRFDYERERWTFELEAIARAEMTDNVIDLMTRKIQRLSPDTQRALTLAACVGNPFDQQTLTSVSEQSPETTANDLKEAIDDGLILRAGREAYSFLHDRVRQSAYALIPAEQKQGVHLTVGRLLRSRADAEQTDERIFDVVHHLNLGSERIEDPAERVGLARLNWSAAQKAKSATAHEAALAYLLAGLRLVTDQLWDSDYELAFALHLDAAECQYHCGNLAEAAQQFDLLLRRAATNLDKARVYRLRSVQYENMSRYADALATARECLLLFGVSFPDSPEERQAALEGEIMSIQILLDGREIASLADLRAMIDPEIRMVMSILPDIWASAYKLGDAVLARLISATMVRLSLVHGNAEESAYGYVTHAITVGPVRGDYKSAYEFGRLALRVNEHFNDRKRRAKIHQQFHAHVNLWRQPMPSCIPYAREACRSGLESGDFLYAAYGASTEPWPAMVSTQDLAQFVHDYVPNLALVKKLKATGFADSLKIILNWARALQGKTRDPLSLSDEAIDESEYVATYRGNPFFTTFHAVTKLQLCYLFGQYDQALRAARTAGGVVSHLSGTIWPVEFDFWSGLTLAANYAEASEDDRRAYLQEMERAQRSFAVLAENCPQNFLCQSLLLSAEIERISGRHLAALNLYERAIGYAEEIRMLQHQALANELCGRFWLERAQPKVAAVFIAAARQAYARWGASAKVADLERRYEPGPARSPVEEIRLELTDRTDVGSIDPVTVMKAAGALAGEIELERLLGKLMAIAIENSDAEHGGLVLEHDGEPRVHAQGSRDNLIVHLHDAPPLTSAETLPTVIVNHVRRTSESVVLADARSNDRYRHDPYVLDRQPRSVLAAPLINQGRLIGVIYLENNLATGVFTPERLALIQVLASQAAIAVQNAQLYLGLKREVADRTRMEATLRIISEGTAALTGPAFFRAVARLSAEAVGTKYAFVAEVSGQRKDRVASLAFWQGGDFTENVSYPLAGTACEPVIAGEICYHSERIQSLFPGDRHLVELSAEGYLGVPLVASSGDVVGHIALIHDEPIKLEQQDLAVLKIVATRAGTELERQRTEDALRDALTEVTQLRDRLQAENVYLLEEVKQQQGFEEIVGRSPVLQRLLRQVEQVAPTDTTVLITGETGTGKELIARAIHSLSGRKDRPMVTVNCGAISAGLVESELFGHENEAFTGAVGRKIGRFELATGGTIFLDEIGDLSLDLQIKLLRVLQEGEFERVGGNRTIQVDVRVIASTHKNLEAAVEEGNFRADLLHLLNLFSIRTPALRERPEDIPALVRYFVMKYASEMGKRIDTVPQSVLDTLAGYTWPGNVRELANILERSVIISQGTAIELGEWIALPPEPEAVRVPAPVSVPRDGTLEELTRRRILDALEETGWRVSGPRGAAQMLGLKPTTLEARMKRLGIVRPGAKSQSL